MIDLQWLILSTLSFPAEFLIHCNHLLWFWLLVLATAFLVGPLSAFLVLVGALFTLLASYWKRPNQLPLYKGYLDVYFGRSYRASTLTPGMDSNNNVTITTFRGDLIMAYRKAPDHFASPLAEIHVAKASPNNLEEWTEVWKYTTGADDLRETLLFEMKGKLIMYFVCLEPNKRGFKAKGIQWTSTTDLKKWTAPLPVGKDTEMVWDIKVRENEKGEKIAYKSSFIGNCGAWDCVCHVLFEQSDDGVNWKPVGASSAVYTGGITEVSFDFTDQGDLIAVGRNEDGDETGFGSQLWFAKKEDLGTWIPLKVSLPWRFDSPRMVNMEGELLLFARYARESYCLVPKWMPFGLQRFANLIMYSLLPKSGAVYCIRQPDKDGRFPAEPVELVREFEETHGDTGFFSVAKVDNSDDWIVANYSSSCHSHAMWLYGQEHPTDVYVCRCRPIKLKR